MTFSGIHDPSLPAGVLALGTKERMLWVHVANGALAEGKGELTAGVMANGVLKEKSAVEIDGMLPDFEDNEYVRIREKYYQYVDSWEVASRGYLQDEASYDPVGGLSGGKACANCRWFINPARCVLVSGDIVPTGKSALWTATPTYEPQPLEVFVVNKAATPPEPAAPITLMVTGAVKEPPAPVKAPEPAVAATAVVVPNAVTSDVWWSTAGLRPAPAVQGGRAKSVFGKIASALGFGEDELDESISAPLVLFKDAEGRTRFLTTISAAVEDRDGETILSSAHKEYVDWAEGTKRFPELWLWHTKGTKFGQLDWLDFADGFLVGSGTIDEGFEPLAKTLAEQEVGISHGFVCKEAGGIISKYRTFEVSVLPRTNASVPWTGFDLLSKETGMPLTQQRKDWLISVGVKPDVIAQFEKNNVDLADRLKALNITFKGDEGSDAAAAAAAAVNGEQLSGFMNEISVMAEGLSGLADVVGKVKAAVDKLAQDDDAKFEEKWKSVAARQPGGFSASSDPSTVVTADQVKVKQAATTGLAETDDTAWFDQAVLGAFGKAL